MAKRTTLRCRGARGTALAAAFVALGVACSKPEPPQITPQTVTVRSISPKGAQLDARLDAWNPNAEDLTAQSVDTTITIGGKPNVARVVMSTPLTLPAKQRLNVEIPIAIEWTDPAALAELAAAKQAALYQVEGSVDFAGPKLQVTAPFRVGGQMSAAELAMAAAPAAATSAAPATSASAAPSGSASAAPAASASAKPPPAK